MRRRLFTIGALWLVGLVGFRAVVLPPEACADVTVADLESAVTEAAGWIERAALADGRYVYEYDRSAGEALPGYNMVRHAGTTMSLYQVAAAGDRSVLPAADGALEYMLANVVHFGERAALGSGNADPKLGSTALMLAGLAHRRMATGDGAHDILMHQLAAGIGAQQRADGSLLYLTDHDTGEPVPDITSLYSTGEAFWALTLMHELFPEHGYDRSARAVADYIATSRDEDEDITFAPWADQWSAYGFGEMVDWGLTDEHRAYLRALADRFGLMARGEAQRQAGGIGKLIRGGEGRGAGFGTVVEGLSGLWRASAVDPQLRDLHADLRDRLVCGASILVRRQQTAAAAAAYADPDLVAGAWYRDDITRMDDQQHAMSGLLLTIPAVAEPSE